MDYCFEVVLEMIARKVFMSTVTVTDAVVIFVEVADCDLIKDIFISKNKVEAEHLCFVVVDYVEITKIYIVVNHN